MPAPLSFAVTGTLKKSIGTRVRLYPQRILLVLIGFYQRFLSPLKLALLGPYAGCRFYPTCSHYAAQCISRHGAFKGGLLALGRILRCQPFHPGGFDPPPDAFTLRRIPRHQASPNQHSTVARKKQETED